MEHLYIGIDIGGTNLRFALLTGSGDILHRSRMFSDIENGRQDFCDRLLMGIEELRLVAASRNAAVAGIGVGVPGLIDRKGMIHSSVNMRPLDGFNLAVFIKAETGLPAVCANDANLIALGEQAFRAGRRFESCMVVTIGTGLGSGLILDGRLWTGASGFAAEFGHVTVDPDGLPCPCGNRGCLERYVSAGALVRFATKNLSPDIFKQHGDIPDAAMIARLARGGEQGAIEAFSTMGRWLATGLASLLNTLNLEAIIIGGGVAASFDLFLPALTAELEKRCFPEIFADLSIVKSELGDDAGLLGGAALIATLLTE